MKKKSKILPHEREKIEQFVVEALIKGYSTTELKDLLAKDYQHIDESDFDRAIRASYIAIRENTLVEVDKIIPQHIELYEKVYKEFDDLYYIPGKLKALRQKEKLVGLLKESNFVEIHNEINVEIETEPEYDLNKLTNKEQKRLNDLMKRVLNK